MGKVSFTHLRVEKRGTTVAGQVWNEGDLVPLDGSTPEPVHPAVLEAVAEGAHPLLTAGTVGKDSEFKPIKVKAAEEPKPEE